MDNFGIEKAKKYIEQHNAFSDVNFSGPDANGVSTITASVKIGLPSKYLKAGITSTGVKAIESVKFLFPKTFPLQAPKIYLRDDFPRGFPHINSSEKEVSPCVYEGSVAELLQQSEWLNGLLNQLVDWLEKAASNDLLNYKQGWEPMRNDDSAGFIIYDTNLTLKAFEKNGPILTANIKFKIVEGKDGKIVANQLNNSEKTENCTFLCFLTPDIIGSYIPNPVRNLADLYSYGSSIGLPNLKVNIESIDEKYSNENWILLTLAVKRPCKLIGQDTNIEFLNYIIKKSKPRKGKKRVLPEISVKLLNHISQNSTILLRKLSGTKSPIDENKYIALVGCGSLGSKIGLHLARNGNSPFLCVDGDIFLPHNAARHGLFLAMSHNKADLLATAINNITKGMVDSSYSAFETDFGTSRIIIDSTASLAVRSFFIKNKNRPSVISTGLYHKGNSGIAFIEANNGRVMLCDLWAYFYNLSIENEFIRELLFSQQTSSIQIGQSCRSSTLVVSDARISQYASLFSEKIQDVLERGVPNSGQILQLEHNDNYSISSNIYNVDGQTNVCLSNRDELEVRVLDLVVKKISEQSKLKAPNETGGVLLGTIFPNTNIIVVSDILPPPTDSIETPSLFVLGIDGLETKIKCIEKRTHGKVTYLGTWHSHPHGGQASQTDKGTFKKLLFVRNYEPTVCLIWTPNGIIRV